MFTFETRPTDPVKIAKLALGAVFAAVVMLLFVAPLVVQYDLQSLSPGDDVVAGTIGGSEGEFAKVVEIGFDTVTIRTPDGKIVVVPRDIVEER